MRFSYFFAAALAGAWGLLVLSGLDFAQQAKLQGISADMLSARTTYYLYFPLSVFLFVFVAWFVSRYRAVRSISYSIYVLATVALPCYLLFYTGGM